MGALILAAGSALDADALALLDAAASAGFDGVGLRLSHGRAGTVPALRAIRTRADDLGIFVHDVEVHRVGEGVAFDALLEAAVEVGSRRILAVSDVSDLSRTVESVSALVAQARPLGIEVGVEYMAWTTPNAPADAIRVAKHSGCTVIVDVLHHHRVGAGTEEMRALVLSGTLGWVQLCDVLGTSAPRPPIGPTERFARHEALRHEARHERLPPGEGDLPLDELLAAVPPEVTRSVEVQSDTLAATTTVRERAALLYRASQPWRGASP